MHIAISNCLVLIVEQNMQEKIFKRYSWSKILIHWARPELYRMKSNTHIQLYIFSLFSLKEYCKIEMKHTERLFYPNKVSNDIYRWEACRWKNMCKTKLYRIFHKTVQAQLRNTSQKCNISSLKYINELHKHISYIIW